MTDAHSESWGQVGHEYADGDERAEQEPRTSHISGSTGGGVSQSQQEAASVGKQSKTVSIADSGSHPS